MIIILLLAITIASPLIAMEPNESTPLQEQPLVIEMKDSSPLFAHNRRFYDDQSKNAFKKAVLKKCLCQTAAFGLSISAIGCLCGTGCAGCMTFCCGSSNGTLFCFAPGGLFAETNILCGGAGCAIGTCMGSATFGPKALSMTDDAQEIHWNNHLTISDDIVASADNTKFVNIKKDSLRKLLAHAATRSAFSDCAWPWIARITSCFYTARQEQLKTVQKQLADTYENIVPISEQELLGLLQNTPLPTGAIEEGVIDAYARLALLAHHGWISFAKTEDHPIRCQTKFFDKETLHDYAKKWYCSTENAVIYLPKNNTLAQVYQFENDPEYQGQIVDPQMYALREKRRDFLQNTASSSNSVNN